MGNPVGEQRSAGGVEFEGMDEDEVLLVQARRRTRELSEQLAAKPFEQSTVEALRAYAEGEAEPAVRAWDRLRQRPAAELRARWRDLTSRTSLRRAR